MTNTGIPGTFYTMQSRSQIRQQMRRLRRNLSPDQQRRAAAGLVRNMRSRQDFIRARHIALYLANDGEIDPRPLIRLCHKLGKQVYLPVLHPILHNRLWFLPYSDTTIMRRNIYGIEEPSLSRRRLRPAWALDLVLLPLVAFDPDGNRMGMGGGYYDRTFSFKQTTKGLRGPALIGLAHDIQKVEKLPVESWDIPLRGIVTDLRIYP